RGHPVLTGVGHFHVEDETSRSGTYAYLEGLTDETTYQLPSTSTHFHGPVSHNTKKAMSFSVGEYADIANKLHAACSFPIVNSLSDKTCCICQETYLEGSGAEIPVTLVCGHTFGLACTLKWTFGKIEEGRTGSGCPQCRQTFFRYEQHLVNSTEAIGAQSVPSSEDDHGIGRQTDNPMNDTPPVTSRESHEEGHLSSRDRQRIRAEVEEIFGILERRSAPDRRNSHLFNDENDPPVHGSQTREPPHHVHETRTPHSDNPINPVGGRHPRTTYDIRPRHSDAPMHVHHPTATNNGRSQHHSNHTNRAQSSVTTGRVDGSSSNVTTSIGLSDPDGDTDEEKPYTILNYAILVLVMVSKAAAILLLIILIAAFDYWVIVFTSKNPIKKRSSI
ncbi:MAG: hypothetical protein Q9224_006543, partial [Gallowayella concinna]